VQVIGETAGALAEALLKKVILPDPKSSSNGDNRRVPLAARRKSRSQREVALNKCCFPRDLSLVPPAPARLSCF
jgi:hypothetical protein